MPDFKVNPFVMYNNISPRLSMNDDDKFEKYVYYIPPKAQRHGVRLENSADYVVYFAKKFCDVFGLSTLRNQLATKQTSVVRVTVVINPNGPIEQIVEQISSKKWKTTITLREEAYDTPKRELSKLIMDLLIDLLEKTCEPYNADVLKRQLLDYLRDQKEWHLLDLLRYGVVATPPAQQQPPFF